MNKYSKFSSWCSAQAAARGESWTLPWWPTAMASTLRGTVVELQQLMKAGPWKLGFCWKKRRDFFGGVFYLYGPAYQYLLTVFFEKTYFLQFWGPSFPMVFGVVFLGMGSGWRWRFCFMFLLVWIVQTDCLTIV